MTRRFQARLQRDVRRAAIAVGYNTIMKQQLEIRKQYRPIEKKGIEPPLLLAQMLKEQYKTSSLRCRRKER